MKDGTHLRDELYQLVRSDPVIFDFLQDGSLDGIWYWDIEVPEWEWMSPRFWEVLGVDPSNKRHLAGEWQDLIHPEDLKLALHNFTEHCKNPNHPYDQVVRYKHTSGSTVWVRCRGMAIRDKTGRPVRMLGAHTDITALKQAEAALKEANDKLEKRVEERTAELRQREEELRQAKKMEAVGRLAGGIAHDFNNMLSVILGYSQKLLVELPESSPFREQLEDIRDAGERAGSLTRQLLAFSRKQILKPRTLNLNAIVKDLDKMIRRVIGEDIDLVTSLRKGIGFVWADPGQMEQVFMNLVINARDAMPKGGKLTIETAAVYLDESYQKKHPEASVGPHVMLAFTDTGGGMTSETRERVFEPFFTTKKLGKGTGMGLSTVYGIVKQSGGNIWIYSELERGTTFKIYLPLEDSEPETEKEPAPALVAKKATETILVVEDEDLVLKLIREVLEMTGYTVISTGDPDEALTLSADHQERIHLLLTDVVLPKMGGRELAEALCKTRPDMEVLYMSGYTDDAIVHHGVLDRGTAFLEKPITPQLLLKKVREVLGSEQ